MKKFLLLSLTIYTLIAPVWAQDIQNKFTTLVWDENTGNPRFAVFKDKYAMPENAFFSWLYQEMDIQKQIVFELISEETDNLGITHKKYSQQVNGKEIFAAMLITHLVDGKVESFNGEYYKNISISESSGDSRKCIETIDLLIEKENQYDHMQYKVNEKYCGVTTNKKRQTAVPCYEVTVENDDHSWANLYLWDITSAIVTDVYPLNVHTDSSGKAVTHYIGTQNITADYLSPGKFRLRENVWRHVGTYKTTLYNDYTDSDNIWDTDKPAGDVHKGAELVSDMLKDYFGRDGYGNKGDTFRSVTTSGSGNAFWNLSQNVATFLIGSSGNVGPCASIDVVGHEYGHGIADESGGLLYSGEACALHESFADITGHMTEFYRDSATANWYIGEEVWKSSNGIRYMRDPYKFNDPKAYGGKFFPKGCHGSGGVQNYWFYLMVNGDTGKNEFNYSYSLKGLGHDKAVQITYRNMFFYMIPQATFKDAFYGTIKAAKDLYGGCSNELDYTFKAWKAVNVDDPNLTAIDLSHGIAAPAQVCTGVPVNVNLGSFGDKSRTVKWLINNKDTSTKFALSYTFNKTGFYPVLLETNTCGTIFKDSVIIAVNVLPNPSFIMPYDTACLTSDTFVAKNNTINTDLTIPLKYQWYIEPLDEFVDAKDLKKLLTQKFTYKFTLKAYYEGGCWNKITKELAVTEAVKPDFSVLRNSCQDKEIKLNNLTDTVNRKLNFKWIFSDGDTVSGYLPFNKTLKTYGTQPIVLLAESGYRGCADTAVRTIEIYRNPEPDFTYDSFCRNTTANLYVGGKYYYPPDWTSWHVGYANPINRDTFVVDVLDSATRYIGLTISDKRGCNATIYKTISTAVLSGGLAASDVCNGDSVRLNYQIKSSSAYTLKLETGDGKVFTSPVSAYKYSAPGVKTIWLHLQGNGCKVSQSVAVAVKEKPTVAYQADDVCFGDTAVFKNNTSHSDSIRYQWFFADGSESLIREPRHVYKDNETKTYFVTLKATYNNGCRDSLSKPLTVHETPLCGFTVSRDPADGNNAFVFTPATRNQKAYNWVFGDGKTSSDTVARHKYAANGNYLVTLKITSDAGCSCEGSDNLQAIYVGVNHEQLPGYAVYPNPFNNKITIKAADKSAFTLTDINGRLIAKGNLNKGENTIVPEVLATGMYLLKIETGNGQSMQYKLHKQ